jgi:hypothetical protein
MADKSAYSPGAAKRRMNGLQALLTLGYYGGIIVAAIVSLNV